jgi:hypothetical protein
VAGLSVRVIFPSNGVENHASRPAMMAIETFERVAEAPTLFIDAAQRR